MAQVAGSWYCLQHAVLVIINSRVKLAMVRFTISTPFIDSPWGFFHWTTPIITSDSHETHGCSFCIYEHTDSDNRVWIDELRKMNLVFNAHCALSPDRSPVQCYNFNGFINKSFFVAARPPLYRLHSLGDQVSVGNNVQYVSNNYFSEPDSHIKRC